MIPDISTLTDALIGDPRNTFAVNQHERPLFIRATTQGNRIACDLNSKLALKQIRKSAKEAGARPSTRQLREGIEYLVDEAHGSGVTVITSLRIARHGNGIALDTMNGRNEVVLLSDGEVKRDAVCPEVVFLRTDAMLPYPEISEEPDLTLLRKYLNISDMERFVLEMKLCHILATPIGPHASFPITHIQGQEGSAKTTAAKLKKALVDPNRVDAVAMPKNQEELYHAMAGNLLTIIDNARTIPDSMSDLLAAAAYGINAKKRQLYTDLNSVILPIQGSICVTSIDQVFTQPDAMSRLIPITTKPISKQDRKSEAQLFSQFEEDKPKIFTALLKLTAKIIDKLPDAVPTNPERMAGFSHFLAAAELADAVPAGHYQGAYSALLESAMSDIAEENELISAISKLLNKYAGEIDLSPAELLKELTLTTPRELRSVAWPRDPSSLSRKLNTLKGLMASQGIRYETYRHGGRKILITRSQSGD
ncbi:MAG: hypothetical protein HWE12_06460 [Oceanospirillaceae bacterium]|nr:hypothetical protein [Oceanospirillaceae bacterium]